MPEFGLSYTAAGLVMSIYMLPYALMQVPSGILSDRWGPRRTMLLFLTITMAGNLAFSQADRLELLLLSRIVMGFGSSVIYINTIKIIERWLPQGRLAMGLGVLSAASPSETSSRYSDYPTSTRCSMHGGRSNSASACS